MDAKTLFEGREVKVINMGLKSFQDSVKSQNTECIHVDWVPPAGGDLQLIEILDRLKKYL